MALRVLISAPYLIPEIERFRPLFSEVGIEILIPEVQERLSEREMLELVGKIDGAICGDDGFTARVFAKAAPRLKVVSKWGTGIDSIDRQAAAAYGVEIRNTPDAFTDAVADSVMSYVLAFARRTPWMDQAVKSGVWVKQPGRSLRECTLGVVGVGRIGKAVLRRAQAFGMSLLGNDVVDIPADFLEANGVSMLPLGDLLVRSDFVSLNCDLNPTSRHLIGEAELSQMRPSAVLINTARGPIIDEIALVKALQRGDIAGAALDVFEEEPLPADSPLRTMNNVMLAPHNANASPEAWERVHWNTIRNLIEGLGLTPPAESEMGPLEVRKPDDP